MSINSHWEGVFKPEYYCQISPVGECNFCVRFSFKADGYTEKVYSSTVDVQQ